MTPLERLLAEELPTGTFGGPPPATRARPAPQADRPAWTPAQQAAHRQALEAELDHHEAQPRRHLRALPPAA